jgi:long-chain acyl-CoA synthetase
LKGYGDHVQIRTHAAMDPKMPAVILYPSAKVVTFGDLEARADQLAHYFSRSGLREGDAIAILMENNEHIHAVMWAARRSGMYYVPINTHLAAAEAAYIVDNSNAVAIIGSAALRATLKDLSNHLRRGLPDVLMIADDDMDGWHRYPECVASQPATPVDDEREGDLLQYSSGTTGRPKGIKRELSSLPPSEAPNLLSPLLSALEIDRTAVYLGPAPLYHTAPSMWSMCVQAVGAAVVVMEKFDPEGCLDVIQRYRVTHGQFVPAMFIRMLKLPTPVRDSYDLSTLVRVVHAAAPCPVEIKKQMIDWWGPIIDEFYASSEGAGITYIAANE